MVASRISSGAKGARRATFGIAAMALTAMLAVACSGAPAGPTAPADPIRVVKIAPADKINIADWGVLSGADASLGQDSLTGVQIAIDDKGGKLLGHDINLKTEDGLCTVDGGAAAAQKLAADTTLVGLIGSSCSDETVGGIASITNAGLTTISASNTRPALTFPNRGPEYAGYARTAHSDAFQGKAVAEFVYNVLKKTKAATIHDGSAYAEALQQVFADEFKKLGGTITIQDAVSKGQTDMKPVLIKVAGTSPEVIYDPVFVAEGGYLWAQHAEVPGLENVIMIGSDGMFTGDFVKAAGPAALNNYLSSPNFSAFQGTYAAFVDKYKAKVGKAPISAFHAHAYDATNILFNALEKVAVKAADGTVYIPMKALRDAIFATKDFKGITGTLSCSPTGDCGAPLIAMYQIGQAEVDGSWPPAKPVWP
jgi:branched-chain amino acid transport system substrate-binding protein